MKKLLIKGNWRDSGSCETLPVIDPRTGQEFCRVASATKEDVREAIDAADQAFDSWSKRSLHQRTALLREASKLVMDKKEEIARAMTQEQGKPFPEALGEVVKGADILHYYAEEGERVYGRIVQNAEADIQSAVIYQPVGVCAAIVPWNYPIELLAWKVGAALAAGCTIVCKFASDTPLSSAMFAEQINAAGFPAGVLNTVNGPGRILGNEILRNSKVKKVAFTGSTEVGISVLTESAGTLKKTSMELGGSLPMLVFKDCDLAAAVTGAVRRSFRNMGQICIAINRIYVEQEIYEIFLKRFTEAAQKLVVGDGFKDGVDLGPMCNEASRKTTDEHVRDAVEKGARLLCGGKIPKIEGFENGYWYEPSIVADATQDMKIMTEETFGPAVGVNSFNDIDEAIRLANDSLYGLAAIVYSSNIHTVKRCAYEIAAGNVAVNNVDAGVINAPYGGWKESGFGYEHGPEGLMEYFRAKHIRIKA